MSPTPDRTPRMLARGAAQARAAARERSLSELKERLRRLDAPASPAGVRPLGAAAIDRLLPGGGLALGALHEIAPESPLDHPAALGFLVALAGAVVAGSGRPLLLACPRGGAFGRIDGHGLGGLGLPPGEIVLVETGDDAGTLWALEEALRSRALGAVAGCLLGGLDLHPSRRLHLAAAGAGGLHLVLGPPGPARPNAAATRWRIGAAQGARDRFGCLARPRWRVALERCRGGRPGAWEVEFDRATHRFGLA